MTSNINDNKSTELDLYGFIDTIVRNKILFLFFILLFFLAGWVYDLIPTPQSKKVSFIISELDTEQEPEIGMLNGEIHQLVTQNDEIDFYQFTKSAKNTEEIRISLDGKANGETYISTDYVFEQTYNLLTRKLEIVPLILKDINKSNDKVNHTYTYEEILDYFEKLDLNRRSETISDNFIRTIIDVSILTGDNYEEILKNNYIFETAIKVATAETKKHLNRKIDTIVRLVDRKIDFQISKLVEYNDILASKSINRITLNENSNSKSALLDFYKKVIEENPDSLFNSQNSDFGFIPDIKMNEERDKYYETLLLIEKMKKKAVINNFNEYRMNSYYLQEGFYSMNFNPYSFKIINEINQNNGYYRLPVHPLIFFPIAGFFISLFFIFFIDGYRKHRKNQ